MTNSLTTRVRTAIRYFHPIRAIEWGLVVGTLINGIYLLSPLYAYSQAVNGKTAFASALGDPIFTSIYAIFLIVSALLLLFGIVKGCPKLRARGLLLHALSRGYNILLTILVAGILPLTYLSSLILLYILIVLWIHERRKLYVDASA